MKKFLITLFIFGFALVVICGVGLYAQGEKLEKEDSYNDKVTTNLSKKYKKDIRSIEVNSDMSDVTIKKGNHFSVTSRGDDKNVKVKSYIKDKQWILKEETKESVINFRPLNNVENHITITVPKKTNKLSVNANDGDLKVNNINVEKAKLNADSADISINKGKFDQLYVNNDSGDISTSNINSKKHIKLINDSGDINLQKMQPDVNTNIKNDSGDISLHYKEKPKDTLLKIHNDSGDSYVGLRELKDKKVGNGSKKLQLFNDSGDIKVN